MLKFQVFEQGCPAQQWRLRNAYLVGSDHSAMRADVTFADGLVLCQKREVGSAALVLQHRVGDCGELTIQTCLLPERNEPYILSLELARHRLMLIYNKLEEWGMFELSDDHPVAKRIDRARRLFTEALCLHESEPAQADRAASECLVAAIDASEELALAHAEILLNRRRQTNSLPRYPIGTGLSLDQNQERVRAALANNFDFLAMPTPWRSLAPAEGAYKWDLTDNWVEWAARARMPIVAGPVVSFEPSALPDWVYMWEHDYETVRDLLYEHTERTVNRYKGPVAIWNVAAGLHVNNHFPFSFDQVMELTRMCTMLVRKLHPASRVLIEIRQPFGEYYSTNPRSIPPLMYADLLVQNAVNFDGFVLRLLMGQAQPGQHPRDLMQLSALIDQFGTYGKSLHVALGVPSEPVTELMIAAPAPNEPVDPHCGFWRKPWSQLVQSRWLEAMFHVALSKPFVESVAWSDAVDHSGIELPLSGLVSEDLQPKSSFRRLINFRRSLSARSPLPVPAGSAAANPPGPASGPAGG